MPNAKFLETYTLYRKFEGKFMRYLHDLPKPAINMPCLSIKCNDGQTRTFNMIYHYNYTARSILNVPDVQIQEASGQIVNAVYQCDSCKSFNRAFVLLFDHDLKYVMKIGQYPPWNININKDLEKMLGVDSDIYKKGLISESQGYGIGSFAYYRRIIEGIIDELLSGIEELIPEEHIEEYTKALLEVKKAREVSKKIELVRHLLPNSLKPDGHNPLSLIYGELSIGLHGETDEECLEKSEVLRESLEFLVTKIYEDSKANKKFKDGLKKILSKKPKMLDSESSSE